MMVVVVVGLPLKLLLLFLLLKARFDRTAECWSLLDCRQLCSTGSMALRGDAETTWSVSRL